MEARATCPCCGAETDRPAFVDLNTNRAVVGERSVYLSPTSAEILYALLEKFPGTVSPGAIVARIYGAAEEPEHAADTLRVRIHQLRRQVAPLGLRIVNTYGRGYAAKMDDRAPVVAARPRGIVKSRKTATSLQAGSATVSA